MLAEICSGQFHWAAYKQGRFTFTAPGLMFHTLGRNSIRCGTMGANNMGRGHRIFFLENDIVEHTETYAKISG